MKILRSSMRHISPETGSWRSGTHRTLGCIWLQPIGGFLSHGATPPFPKSHPFSDWDFPWNQPDNRMFRHFGLGLSIIFTIQLLGYTHWWKPLSRHCHVSGSGNRFWNGASPWEVKEARGGKLQVGGTPLSVFSWETLDEYFSNLYILQCNFTFSFRYVMLCGYIIKRTRPCWKQPRLQGI